MSCLVFICSNPFLRAHVLQLTSPILASDGAFTPSLRRVAHLGLRLEAVPREELAFESREEALAHGVVIGVPDRTHRGAHTALRWWCPNSIEVYWADLSDRRNTIFVCLTSRRIVAVEIAFCTDLVRQRGIR